MAMPKKAQYATTIMIGPPLALAPPHPYLRSLPTFAVRAHPNSRRGPSKSFGPNAVNHGLCAGLWADG